MKNRWVVLCLILLLSLAFCSKSERAPVGGDMPPAPMEAAEKAGYLKDQTVARAEAPKSDVDTATMSGEDKNADAPAVDTEKGIALRGRKLIREGQMALKVKDVDQSRLSLEAMAGKAGGFISNVQYQRGSVNRTIELTLRLPAEGFLSFIDAVRAVGFVTDENFNVIDVTDQYVDLGRRISTNEKIAARLEELIKERGYQFKDLLAVQQELARLQMENERLIGSRQGLDDRIALSTLHVRMFQEVEQTIVPPDSAFAPFVKAIENAGPQFRKSIHAIMALAGGLISLTVYLLPWSVPAIIVWFALRALMARRRRKKAARAEKAKS